MGCLAIVYAIGWVRVEVASPPEGERATLAILVWQQTLAHFLCDVSLFCVVSHKNQVFLVGNEYLGVKKTQVTPYCRIDIGDFLLFFLL